MNYAIAYVEENAFYTAAGSPLDGVEDSNSWQVSCTFADVAHASGNLGTGVRVAILDTGIDYAQEDLDGNYRGGYDFVFGDNDPFDDSYNSHGSLMGDWGGVRRVACRDHISGTKPWGRITP